MHSSLTPFSNFNITGSDLYDLFGKYGAIRQVRIGTDTNLKTKGTAYVVFENPDDAKAAAQHLNGFHLMERYIVGECWSIGSPYGADIRLSTLIVSFIIDDPVPTLLVSLSNIQSSSTTHHASSNRHSTRPKYGRERWLWKWRRRHLITRVEGRLRGRIYRAWPKGVPCHGFVKRDISGEGHCTMYAVYDHGRAGHGAMRSRR
jgi:hypothetical protein